eukprot:1154873-Pelagomonas_calceolata.AAC.6
MAYILPIVLARTDTYFVTHEHAAPHLGCLQYQVASMRRKAEQNVQQLLQSLDSKSAAAKSGAGGAGAEGSISSAMKAKLQNAVKAMQQGLVERDTEVCVRMCV